MSTKIIVSRAQNDRCENFGITTVIWVKITVILMQDNGHFSKTTVILVQDIGQFGPGK